MFNSGMATLAEQKKQTAELERIASTSAQTYLALNELIKITEKQLGIVKELLDTEKQILARLPQPVSDTAVALELVFAKPVQT
jgi:hypothetical protein